jgi:NADH dehydrogenase [ubiquinone] 1 alpha subcomplex assembly factor 5
MKAFSIRAFIPPPVLRRRCLDRRYYAVQAAGTPTVEIFNNRTKWLQKEKAAADVEGSRKVDYLRDEVASRLSERLLVDRPGTLCLQ